MPIEIKELYIKINVNDAAQTNASEQKVSGGRKDEIIKACLEQVTHIQNRKNER
mgnify:CR=1 FL=1|tara:strand:+ start:82 stop:243 length:162 start_codon:yes stop_codon:yes gene_type:complete